MRVAIISDTHGNGLALEAVLADLKRDPVEQLVCLGDTIQGGPQPALVVRRLRELGCPVVMGNADAWLLSGEETGAEQFSDERLRKMRAVRKWSLAQLSEADRAFIAAFHPTVTLALAPHSGEGESLRDSPAQAQLALAPNRNLLCFHGSPASFDDVILPSTSEEEFQKYLSAYTGHLLCGGHTHLQQIRRLGDGFFFNPGSAGLAYSHTQPEDSLGVDPWAEYAVLSVEGGRSALEFRKVPFDVSALIDVYRASGRPFAEDAIAQYPPHA